jgi:hypothetical protein
MVYLFCAFIARIRQQKTEQPLSFSDVAHTRKHDCQRIKDVTTLIFRKLLYPSKSINLTNGV